MVVCIGEEITKVAWRGFVGRKWKEDINVREFIQNNYTMYETILFLSISIHCVAKLKR